MPHILSEIRRGNPSANIKILIATGCHRASTQEEITQKFGETIASHEEIINHDCREQSNMVFKGMMPSGGELWLNSLVGWADLVMSEGFIEPHFFAGFSGGRKSILPGIAAEKTVLANHCAGFLESEKARTGNLADNPVHLDMLFAAKAAKLKFILNVVLDGEKNIIGAFAGDSEKAHRAGCEFLQERARVKAVSGDIVITSNGGYPLDQNIYQSVKGMTAAEACVRPGGVIIMAAACLDGHGGESFYRWFAEAKSAKEVADKIRSIPRDQTIPDQWEAQILARVMTKAEVIMVSDIKNEKIISAMHMKYARDIPEAIRTAEKITGENAGIVVIPDGVSVIVN
jgi:nickel-dependent lactate racemase